MTTIANLSSLRAAVRERMARSDLSDDLINGHVRLVEAHIRRKMDMIGLELEADYTIFSGFQDLPADLEEFNYIQTTGDTGCYLTPKTQANAYQFRNDAPGSPRHYLLIGNLVGPTRIEFLPAPSGTFAARLGYRARAELQNDGDANRALLDHPDVYLDGCLHYAHLHLEHWVAADRYRASFEVTLSEATTDDLLGRWGDGPLSPSSSYVEGSVRR